MTEKPDAQSILQSFGISGTLEEPPADYDTTENPIPEDADFSTFDTSKIYECAGPTTEGKTASEKYWHVRQYFINQCRASVRNEHVDQSIAQIKQIIQTGSVEDIKELQKRRHVWRQYAHQYRTDDQPICEEENCIELALEGSKYCIRHILLDPDQKLFAECPNCLQPYPINSQCFRCNGN